MEVISESSLPSTLTSPIFMMWSPAVVDGASGESRSSLIVNEYTYFVIVTCVNAGIPCIPLESVDDEDARRVPHLALARHILEIACNGQPNPAVPSVCHDVEVLAVLVVLKFGVGAADSEASCNGLTSSSRLDGHEDENARLYTSVSSESSPHSTPLN